MAGCEILSSTLSGLVLFAASLCVLLYKYSQDTNDRTREQVLFDASKVALGSLWAGVLTDACWAAGGLDGGGECGLYALEAVLDTTLGMWGALQLMKLSCSWLRRLLGEKKARQLTAGRYRSKTGAFVKVVYAQQLTLWLLALSISKLTVAFLVLSQVFQLRLLASLLLQPVFGVPVLDYLVMALLRLATQSAQLWIADIILVDAKEFASGGSLQADREADWKLAEEGGYIPPEQPKAVDEPVDEHPPCELRASELQQELAALVAALEADPAAFPQAVEKLPGELLAVLQSEELDTNCMEGFLQVDQDNTGVMEAMALFPATRAILEQQELAVSVEQYMKLVNAFDQEQTGSLTQADYPSFVRYVMVAVHFSIRLEQEVSAALAASKEVAYPSAEPRDAAEAYVERDQEQDALLGEDDLQRQLDEANARLQEVREQTVPEDDIEQARLRAEEEEERLQQARQELEDFRVQEAAREEEEQRARTSGSGSLGGGGAAPPGDVPHFDEDQIATPQPKPRKKGCFPACCSSGSRAAKPGGR